MYGVKMAGLDTMDVDEITINDDEINNIIPKDPEVIAELKKENGNALYKTKQYRSALPFYTEAIELCPNTAAYYGNRAACYMMLNKFSEALEDARKVVQLEPAMIKGYVRIAKCGIALGDLAIAEQAIKKVKEFEVDNSTIDNEVRSLEALKQFEREATVAFGKLDYRKVVYCMDRCLQHAPTCVRYKITKAECLAFLGRTVEAQDIANNILHLDSGNADAIYVRGICLFYQDNVDKAFSHFQQVLRLAPDHKKCLEIYKRSKQLKQKKEEGNEAFKSGKFQDAYNIYSDALLIDPQNIKTNAKLYFNKAICASQLSKHKEAVDLCNEAIKLDEDYLKAMLLKAKCQMSLEEYEEAVHIYEKVCKVDKSRENKKLLQDAKQALKKSKRKDYYKILGIEKSASEDEIKKAYRKRALVHHPDRHANATDAERKEQEKKFKEVGEAYGILSDPKKKARYDSGQDLEDFDGGMHDIDPTQVFQAFFSGHGGHAQEFSFSSGGFPGGFSFQFG